MQSYEEQNLKYKKKYLKYKKKYLTLKKGGGRHGTPNLTSYAANWYNNVPDQPDFRRQIIGSNGHAYDLLFYDGNNHRQIDAAFAIEGIVRSNQNDFIEDNWTFGTAATYLREDETTRTILPKVPGSYSGILIDSENTYNSGVPKIIGYVICTQEINNQNGESYIYMDFVELHRHLGQSLGLCTPMIQNMINWLQTVYSYGSFKIYNASEFGLSARKCYLRAGDTNGLNLYYLQGQHESWDINAPEIVITTSNSWGISYVDDDLADGAYIEAPEGVADETYFMVNLDQYDNLGDNIDNDDDDDGCITHYQLGDNQQLIDIVKEIALQYDVHWVTPNDHRWMLETFNLQLNGINEILSNESTGIQDYLTMINDIPGINSQYGSQPGAYIKNWYIPGSENDGPLPAFLNIPYIYISVSDEKSHLIQQFLSNLDDYICYNMDDDLTIQVSIKTENLDQYNIDLLHQILDQDTFWQAVINSLGAFQ